MGSPSLPLLLSLVVEENEKRRRRRRKRRMKSDVRDIPRAKRSHRLYELVFFVEETTTLYSLSTDR